MPINIISRFEHHNICMLELLLFNGSIQDSNNHFILLKWKIHHEKKQLRIHDVNIYTSWDHATQSHKLESDVSRQNRKGFKL